MAAGLLAESTTFLLIVAVQTAAPLLLSWHSLSAYPIHVNALFTVREIKKYSSGVCITLIYILLQKLLCVVVVYLFVF